MHWNHAALDRVLTHEILPLVSKPNRYVGNELGLIEKDWEAVAVRFALSYPDAYEVGASHTGTQILYHIVNRNPKWLLDRVYAPWPDMERQLRDRKIPLWGLQYRRPVAAFDLLGFTLQSELTYTNLLNVLDLSHIAVRQVARTAQDPLVCIGGPCASNPEPLAPFVDFALIGDAEDAVGEILQVIEDWKSAGRPSGRQGVLESLALIQGVYVPSLYEVPRGGRTPRPKPEHAQRAAFPVVARKVPILREEDHPRQMIVSLTETTHDRLPIEVMRGCMRGCRFCQAGYLYRPARERDVDEVVEAAREGIARSGWQEVSLLSLSTADYSQAAELTDRMGRSMVDRGVGVSLPSLRADEFSVTLAESVSRVRKSGFTLAPEAGSQRLRDVINKGISETDILSAVERAMASGWTSIKLYFMIGHPTETEDDFEELALLVEKIKAILRKHPGRRHITLAFSPFVPKSHTPFQWERQDDFEDTREKLAWIKARLKGQGVEIRHHQTADTAIEGLISRGGREIAEVVYGAWRRGARFDGWGEHCRLSYWTDALAEQGLCLSDTFREIGEDEDLPWEVVSFKIDREYFLKERHKAYAAAETDECKDVRCSACGVCDFDSLKNALAEPTGAPAVTDVPSMLQGVPATTVRLRYLKGDAVRFISHLDVLRELERTLRRAEVPVVYSEGFSPRPRLSAGPPLALGWTSDSEWLDVDLAGTWAEAELSDLLGSLNDRVAPGLYFTVAATMPAGTVSLSAGITTSAYHAHLPSPAFAPDYGRLHDATERFLAAPAVTIQRRRKERVRDVDIRPLVYDLSVLNGDTLAMTVATGSQGSVKPTEVLQAVLGLDELIVPLIQVHKLVALTASGNPPDAESEHRAEVTTFETRNTHIWEPARDARGDPGGRSPC